jgi:hypothetical protein
MAEWNGLARPGKVAVERTRGYNFNQWLGA